VHFNVFLAQDLPSSLGQLSENHSQFQRQCASCFCFRTHKMPVEVPYCCYNLWAI